MTPRFPTLALFPTLSGRAATGAELPARTLAARLRRLARLQSRHVPGGSDAHLSGAGVMTRDAARADAARAPWDVTWLPPRGPRLPRGATPQPTPTPGRRLTRAGAAGGRWLIAAWRRHRSRQHIARLDPALLKDIGVTYSEAEHEANLPFWR